MSVEYLPLGWRIGNAAVSYVAYVGQTFNPVGLAVLYPHPGQDLPVWKIVTALLVLQTLAYLVVSDVFLLARLAAYASVALRELL